jgi:hypothetical protein
VTETYRRHLKDACERCGFAPTDPRQLHVHHRDRDRTNNAPENLETLCANCHALEHVGDRVATEPTGEFAELSRQFHNDVALEFAALVKCGQPAGLTMRAMCREAGLSHEGGYRFVRRAA